MKLAIVLVSVSLFAAGCGTGDSNAEDAVTAIESAEDATVETVETIAQADASATAEPPLCLDMGPQTPRDITNPMGTNAVTFPTAPAPGEMNLCNIHTHTNAEHKGPGFSVFVSSADDGGYACDDAATLTAAELSDPYDGAGPFGGVKPGDTIEVHWVHSSCDVMPGEGLGACLTEACTDPLLRVEAQVFLVVNDAQAMDFAQFAYGGEVNGVHQAKALPTGTGEPVTFLGSTTGPSYDQSTCSPAQVTWSVRPQCAKLDISSLHNWAEQGNPFKEVASHGVRQLVTAPELLSPIK
ncbi:MAG: delta-class carbonic anhydrase [Pseudomonadota bacterium]